MSATPRPGRAGATRECPHCKTRILESAAICPACRHHLRFDAAAQAEAHAAPAITPLRVEGTIRHPQGDAPWEYTVVLSIQDERGTEIARKVVGVGAMHADEQRRFTVTVEANPAGRAGTRGVRH